MCTDTLLSLLACCFLGSAVCDDAFIATPMISHRSFNYVKGLLLRFVHWLTLKFWLSDIFIGASYQPKKTGYKPRPTCHESTCVDLLFVDLKFNLLLHDMNHLRCMV